MTKRIEEKQKTQHERIIEREMTRKKGIQLKRKGQKQD